MNQQLQAFARNNIKMGLRRLNSEQVLLFKRMYAPDNMDKNFEEVVADMPAEKLDWAMQQVQRSVDELK